MNFKLIKIKKRVFIILLLIIIIAAIAISINIYKFHSYSKLLPLCSDPDYVEVTFDIFEDEPVYCFQSDENISYIYELVAANQWYETKLDEAASPLVYINIYQNEYRWIVGIWEGEDDKAIFEVEVLKNQNYILSGNHIYTPGNISYNELISKLKKMI